MRLKFANKYWNVVFKRIAGDVVFGEVDEKTKTITLSPMAGSESFTLLNVAVHEFLHAEFPDMSEDKIDDAGYNLARALWRMGAQIVTYEVESDG